MPSPKRKKQEQPREEMSVYVTEIMKAWAYGHMTEAQALRAIVEAMRLDLND